MRHVLRCVVVVLLLASVFAWAEPKPALRIGLTPVFLDDQTSFLQQWQGYLQRELGRPVVFVQRQSYREITDLLLQHQIDAAWICGYPYVRYRTQMQLLAVPSYNREPLYQSYLIVPASDQDTQSIVDLRGKVFAFSDPNSNSGYLYPQVTLRRSGKLAEQFFRRSFFAWTHKNVVTAVADGLANGGAVDGYVWDTLSQLQPELVGRTRIVSRSPKFGFPPFVTHDEPDPDVLQLGKVLREMSGNEAGRLFLSRLNLDGFVSADDHLYDGIAGMVEYFDSTSVSVR